MLCSVPVADTVYKEPEGTELQPAVLGERPTVWAGVSATSCTQELPAWTSRNLRCSFQSLKTFRYRELESASEQKALGTVTLLGLEGKCVQPH